jgi:2-polyprenyl-6-methoxyphenol hydroxylase-like FAD-dependent oxidoreductase
VATVRTASAGPLSSDRIDVLIVGAGPVGLALALQADAHGAHVRVVERRHTVFRPSRAMILHPRTMESLRPLGVTDALLARALRSPQIRIHLASREHTVQLDAFGLANTPFPEPHPHLVTARTCSRDGAAEVSSRYLAGCDGARSTVRTLSRIGWSGGEYRSEAVLADVELASPVVTSHGPCRDRGARAGLFVSVGRTRHLAAAGNATGSAQRAYPWRLWAASARRRAAGVAERHRMGGVIAQVAWSSRIRLPHRLADRFREGRVFLIGDAAHAHSPAGGQGMNTGIQDALNLGWKLAYASRVGDAAAKELLRSYEQERRPVARRILGLTRLCSGQRLASARYRVSFAAGSRPWRSGHCRGYRTGPPLAGWRCISSPSSGCGTAGAHSPLSCGPDLASCAPGTGCPTTWPTATGAGSGCTI